MPVGGWVELRAFLLYYLGQSFSNYFTFNVNWQVWLVVTVLAWRNSPYSFQTTPKFQGFRTSLHVKSGSGFLCMKVLLSSQNPFCVLQTLQFPFSFLILLKRWVKTHVNRKVPRRMNIISTGLLSAEHSSRLPEYITTMNYFAVKDTLKCFWELKPSSPGFQIM